MATIKKIFFERFMKIQVLLIFKSRTSHRKNSSKFKRVKQQLHPKNHTR